MAEKQIGPIGDQAELSPRPPLQPNIPGLITEAPVNKDGSFLVCRLGDYAEQTELRSLVDPLTGLPYPIAPPEEELPLEKGEIANWHHTVFPRRHDVLQTLGGRAMRSSQIQLVAVESHNSGPDAFHKFKVGPQIHRDVSHQLGVCVAAAVGYRHQYGLAVHDGELWVEPLSPAQQAQLTAPAEPEPFEPWQAILYGKFYDIAGGQAGAEEALAEYKRQRAAMLYRNNSYAYEPMRDFLTHMVFQQDLSNVNRRVRHRFLKYADEEKGLELMAIAATELVRSAKTYNKQTLHELFAHLKKTERINPNIPIGVGDIVKYKIGNLDRRRRLVANFHAALRHREEAA